MTYLINIVRNYRNQYFIFTSILLLFLVTFTIFNFSSVLSADDEFYGIGTEYFDPLDYSEESQVPKHTADKNPYDLERHLQPSENKYREFKTNTTPDNYSNDINFIAAGDWNCNKETEKTINKITKLEPELIIGLGDYTVENISPQCWFDISQPIDDKINIVIGNHDLDYQSSYHKLLDHYNLEEPYYSFNFQNIHFLAISSEHPYETGSKQYEFIKNDLEESLQDPSILWRIVFLHKPLYTTAEFDEKQSEELGNTFHELFEKYKVDLVLSGHTQYYQRSLPISYNQDNPIHPVVMDQSNNEYTNNEGIIFVTVGTAGDELHDIAYSPPYYVIQKEQFGFLNFDLTNRGQTLVGTFHDTDDINILDKFVISIDTTGKKTYSEENSEHYDDDNNNNNDNNNNTNYHYVTSEEEKIRNIFKNMTSFLTAHSK